MKTHWNKGNHYCLLPGWLSSRECSSEESTVNAGDTGGTISIPGLRRPPWRRKWQPILVFLFRESPWTEEPDGLQFKGSQRVRHN